MEEKRKTSRCKLEQKLELQKDNNEQQAGFMVNVSTGGMKVILDKDVQINSVLLGELKILPGFDPFYVQGVIVWKKSVDDGSVISWEVGVKFTKVNTISG